MAKVKRNPRIAVVLTPAQYDVVFRLAKLQGTTMSKVLGQLYEQVEPLLRDSVVALEAAAQSKGKPVAQLIEAMSRMQATIQKTTQFAVDQGDMFAGQVARATTTLKKRAAKRAEKPVAKRKRVRG